MFGLQPPRHISTLLLASLRYVRFRSAADMYPEAKSRWAIGLNRSRGSLPWQRHGFHNSASGRPVLR
jgi:hypothetical protein